MRSQVHAERGRGTFARQCNRRQAARRYWVVILRKIQANQGRNVKQHNIAGLLDLFYVNRNLNIHNDDK